LRAARVGRRNRCVCRGKKEALDDAAHVYSAADGSRAVSMTTLNALFSE
jgi:hypothetical protein